jgi:hypothetical protein
MTTPIPSAANIHSPFSVPVSLEWPDFYGFMCEVHKSNDDPAYGFPLYPLNDNGEEDATKGRIFPGTPGGSHPKAMFAKKKASKDVMVPDPSNPGQFIPQRQESTSWKEYRTKNHQSVGAVNWWGEERAGTKHKWILSYAGPLTRHFPDGFQYGSTKQHNEIYCQGGIIAIAPGPVTGAALIKIKDSEKASNPDLANFSHYVVCVCIVEGKEIAYRNLMVPPVFQENMTDKIYRYMQGEKNHDLNNRSFGWMKICEIGLIDYKPATTPFFFSEDGTKAVAIRLKDFKFVADESDGKEVTEEIGSKISLTIDAGATSATFTDDKNDKPYEFREVGDSYDMGVVNLGNVNGATITQEEKSFTVLGEMTGSQIVAVDYFKNTLIECRYKVKSQRGFTKDWVKRKAGPQPEWESELGSTGAVDAWYAANRKTSYDSLVPYVNNIFPSPKVDENLMVGMRYPDGPRNHQDSLWYSDSVFNTLEWTLDGKIQVAVIEVGKMLSNKNDTTRALSETMAARMYVRHLDLRMPLIIVHISEEHLFYLDNGTTKDPEKYERESWSKTFTNPQETTYTHIESSKPAIPEGIGVPPDPPLGSNRSLNWTKVAELWPDGAVHWEWRSKTYRGVPPDTNDDDSKGKINSKSKYNPNNNSLIAKSWTGVKQLQDSQYQTRDMGVAVNPDLDYLANMNLYNVQAADGTFKLYTLESGTMDTEKTMGGKRLYPLGAI